MSGITSAGLTVEVAVEGHGTNITIGDLNGLLKGQGQPDVTFLANSTARSVIKSLS